MAQTVTGWGTWEKLTLPIVVHPVPVPRLDAAPPLPRPPPQLRAGIGYREAARLPSAPDPPASADVDADLGRVARARGLPDLLAIFSQQDAEALAVTRRERGNVERPLLRIGRRARAALIGLLLAAVAGFALVLAGQRAWCWVVLLGPVVLALTAFAVSFARDAYRIEGETTRADPDLDVPWSAALGETIAIRIRGGVPGELVTLRCVESRAKLVRHGRGRRARDFWKWETAVVHSGQARLISEPGTGAPAARLTIPEDGVPTFRHEGRHGVTWSVISGTKQAPLIVLPARAARDPVAGAADAVLEAAPESTTRSTAARPKQKRRKKRRG